FADRARGRGGHLRTHRSADVDPGAPIERLINQRHRRGAPSAKDVRADGHAVRIFPIRINRWTLRGGSSKASVRMRGLRPSLFGNFRRPLVALPIKTLRRWFISHAFPPHAVLWS